MGYILKDDPMSEVLLCIQKVSRGQTYFSPKIINLTEEVSEEYNNYLLLTASEKKIIRLIHQGLSTLEIADKLFVSYRTIEKHRSNIINKLNLDGRKQKLSDWVTANYQLINS